MRKPSAAGSAPATAVSAAAGANAGGGTTFDGGAATGTFGIGGAEARGGGAAGGAGAAATATGDCATTTASCEPTGVRDRAWKKTTTAPTRQIAPAAATSSAQRGARAEGRRAAVPGTTGIARSLADGQRVPLPERGSGAGVTRFDSRLRFNRCRSVRISDAL